MMRLSGLRSLVPIHNPTVHALVPDLIMGINLRDRAQSWDLRADGAWCRVDPSSRPSQ